MYSLFLSFVETHLCFFSFCSFLIFLSFFIHFSCFKFFKSRRFLFFFFFFSSSGPPVRWTAPSVDPSAGPRFRRPQHFALFRPFPNRNSLFFLLSGLPVEFSVALGSPDQAARARTRSSLRIKNLQKSHPNSTRRPPERRTNNVFFGVRREKARNLGPRLLGFPLSGPRPSGPRHTIQLIFGLADSGGPAGKKTLLVGADVFRTTGLNEFLVPLTKNGHSAKEEGPA